MTESVNPTLKKAEDLFKILIWDSVLAAQLTALVAANPWLGVWPIKQILFGLANLISNSIYSKMRLFVDIQAVSFLNHQHMTAYGRAAIELSLISKSKGVDSEEYKAARQKAKDAFKFFVMHNAG